MVILGDISLDIGFGDKEFLVVARFYYSAANRSCFRPSILVEASGLKNRSLVYTLSF